MLGQWTVASLAIHMRVFAGRFGSHNITVTIFTSLVPSVDRFAGCDFGERVATIMSVLPEAARNKVGADCDEDENASNEDCCQSHKVLRIFEFRHPELPWSENQNGPMGVT